MEKVPTTVVAVDVETTGLHSNDRIVSLGAWRINTADLAGDALDVQCLHIICDPGKKSHPRAVEVHGYSDWTLRHQQPFSDHAETVRDFLSGGDLVIAHNASFDLEFIDREYRALGQRGPDFHRYCTMNGYRQSGSPGRASLNAICQEIGLKRIGAKHGALEDAWLALMVYFWLHQAPPRSIRPFATVVGSGAPVVPYNFREPPPLPDGPLPRRRVQGGAILDTQGSNRTSAIAKAALIKEVRPMAILLLEVARADESLAAEEAEILTDLVRATRDRLGILVDDETEREVLAELVDIKPTGNLLTRAARAVYQNALTREAFPRWLANMARADGDLSTSERASIERVKSAIKRVLPD